MGRGGRKGERGRRGKGRKRRGRGQCSTRGKRVKEEG
jgi:hypothetical protein